MIREIMKRGEKGQTLEERRGKRRKNGKLNSEYTLEGGGEEEKTSGRERGRERRREREKTYAGRNTYTHLA